MIQMTGQEAVELITSARDVVTLFGEQVGDKAAERRGRRRYRALAALVHPDRASLECIDPADAARATVRLNDLYTEFASGGSGAAAKRTPKAAAHVVGSNATYSVRTRIRATDTVATYGTGDDLVLLDIARRPDANDAAHALVRVADTFARQNLAAFVPRVLDDGITAGRAWVAYRLPAGMHSLREVLAAHPHGLDGRDWAWMARRILIALAAAGQSHGALSLDTVLIHPDAHGVVLASFGAGYTEDGAAVADLFDALLARGERRQREFAVGAAHLSPERALREYDLLLRHMYGERRFRPFSLHASTA